MIIRSFIHSFFFFFRLPSYFSFIPSYLTCSLTFFNLYILLFFISFTFSSPSFLPALFFLLSSGSPLLHAFLNHFAYSLPSVFYSNISSLSNSLHSLFLSFIIPLVAFIHSFPSYLPVFLPFHACINSFILTSC